MLKLVKKIKMRMCAYLFNFSERELKSGVYPCEELASTYKERLGGLVNDAGKNVE